MSRDSAAMRSISQGPKGDHSEAPRDRYDAGDALPSPTTTTTTTTMTTTKKERMSEDPARDPREPRDNYPSTIDPSMVINEPRKHFGDPEFVINEPRRPRMVHVLLHIFPVIAHSR